MPVIKGTTSGSIKSTALNIPCKIKSFSIFNRAAAVASVNVGILVQGVSETYMIHDHLAAAGADGSSAYHLTDILVPTSAQIVVVTDSHEVDYYFTIE